MCGIHVTISTAKTCKASSVLETRLRNRGPDHLATITTWLDNTEAVELTFTSSVLGLRGDHTAQQPLVNDTTGSVLCWNGEAWKIYGRAITGNDGEQVQALLSTAGRGASPDECRSVVEVLRAIAGPFAFVYFDKTAKRLYYGRDRLGRRSLLVKPGDPFVLSSIADHDTHASAWSEVEADGIYVLCLHDASTTPLRLIPTKHDWAKDESLMLGIGCFNSSVPFESSFLTRQSRVVRDLRDHLTESLRWRLLQVPAPPEASVKDARIAILFSGGLDCTVLARLASDLLPKEQTIDLLNVAFENPRIAAQNKAVSRDDLYEQCPDRITGRKSFGELLQVCQGRRFRLVTVNVPFTDTSEHRSEVIELMYPHNTEMDLSISFALYFAARGQGLGQIGMDSHPEPYQTTARVLLSGLGADELFGGYVRHATAFGRQSYQGLIEELKLDVSRLGKRNLGRDDRVMANWKKEVRFPYLDEEFVKWAMALPVSEKCNFSHGQISGSKQVLRLLADDLGLPAVAQEPKRAIQFGTRTAKMESGKVKGTTFIKP